MCTHRSLFTGVIYSVVFWIICPTVGNASPDEVYVPDTLKPWVQWVKERHPDLSCAVLQKGKACVWPGGLVLNLGPKGGSFVFVATLDKDGDLPLPGDKAIWPLNVRVKRKKVMRTVPVVNRADRPHVVLKRGTHTLSGKFSWTSLPEALPVPVSSGLISLSISGKKIEVPTVSSRGELWLQSKFRSEQVEKESLKVAVHRKLLDGVPFRLITRLELRIAGKAREIELGRVLPNGAVPIAVNGALSHKLTSDYALVVQGKPGVYVLTIESVIATPPGELAPVSNSRDGWPSEEIWVWIADEELRSVEISGSPAIDPQRTSLPPDWKGYPTYILSPKTNLAFKETRRGERGVAPNRIDISRQIWLDLDGRGYTVRDRLSGTMNKGWRLNAVKGPVLGRVAVDGEDQLITADPKNGLSGVELRKQGVSLTAESRMENAKESFDALGWDHDANSLRADLIIPPGWTLIEAVGVDTKTGSWLSSWNLLDIFIVILVSSAVLKLSGVLWGLSALVLLVLTHGESGAPLYIWFGLLAGVALLRVLPEGRFRKGIQAYYWITIFFLAVIAIPFALVQIQTGLFPQLGTPSYLARMNILPLLVPFVAVAVALLAVVGGAAAVIYFICKRSWKRAFGVLLVAGLVGILAMSVTGISRQASYFGGDYAEFKAQAPLEETPAPEAQAPLRRRKMLAKSSYGRGLDYEAQFSDQAQELLQMVDPKAVVQTGPGVPSWQWGSGFQRHSAPRRGGSIALNWSGAVKKNHKVRLYIISPRVNLALSFLRVIFLFSLVWIFVRFGKKPLAQTAALVLLLFLGSPLSVARADTPPSTELLKELEQRVLRDRCTSDCTSASRVNLRVSERGMELDARINSDGDGAWPIPGPFDQFSPKVIKCDGQATTMLRRDTNGYLWVRIPDGVHTLRVHGHLAQGNTVTLQFAEIPRHVTVKAPGWEVDGLGVTGNVGPSLQLIRKSPVTSKVVGAEEGELALPQWYRVRRELTVAIPWTVRTTVERLGSRERSQMTKIPLLKGEAITSSAVKVEKGYALVRFSRGENQVSWIASMPEIPELKLTAHSGSLFTEDWELRCSSIYRCSYEGIAPVHSISASQNVVKWIPWPGERVSIKVGKPFAVEGQSVTIDQVDLQYTPGIRLLTGALGLTIRTSQGGWRKITMPEGVEVYDVKVNGVTKTIRPEGRELALPLSPGSQNFKVDWRQSYENRIQNKMPSVNLGGGAVNANISVKVPSKRWVLCAYGPKWGPVFLYWGELVLVVLVSLFLGLRKVASLGIGSWVLLGLGLSTLPVVAMFVVPLWLVVLKLRSEHPAKNRFVFNAVQVGLALFTLVSLVVLCVAVAGGLIGSPDMGIEGYGSTNWMLKWYVDRIASALPAPSVVSLPLWVWHALMFLWSAWLVYALFGWLRWGWECVTRDGLWRTKATEGQC